MTIYKLLRGRNSFFPNRRTLFLLAGLLLSVIAVAPQKAAAQTNDNWKWLGSYTFDDKAQAPKRRNSVDVVPLASYDINVEEAADGRMTAVFSANGTQLFDAYECSVKATDDRIEFYYEKFAADGVKDLRKFKKGELLFSLSETRVGKTTKYPFQPAAYKLVRYQKSRQNQPVYFMKQENAQ